jgi:hypothetical protein
MTTVIRIAEMASVLKSLAKQEDPYGQQPALFSQQTVDVIAAAASLLESLALKYAKGGYADHHGAVWSAIDDQCLRDSFHAKASLTTMAKRHGRTEVAIRYRLVNLGLIGRDDYIA